uniref:Uncharacterized protein n=1 Tax=Cyprinus carpio TaxID=7962 RepID=A0A8C2FFL9_CYPCA
MNFLLETLRLIVLTIYYHMEAFIKLIVPQRKKDVSGEIVLITGAGSGIGRLMALEFAPLDVSLVLWDINVDGLKETAKQVKEKGPSRVHYYQCDCSDREVVYQVADQVSREIGDVTILINNAGIVSGKRFMDTPDALVEKTLRVNAMSHFWTYKAFLPAMTDKNHGHLVSVASSAGLIGVNGLAGNGLTCVLLSFTQLLSCLMSFWNGKKFLQDFEANKHVWQHSRRPSRKRRKAHKHLKWDAWNDKNTFYIIINIFKYILHKLIRINL